MDLPPEINYNIFYYLPIESILNACQSDPILSDICTDDIFWKNKFKYDYLKYIDSKPDEISWKQAYMDLVKNKIKLIPLYLRGQEIFDIWISKSNTEKEIHDYIMSLFEQHNFFIHIMLKSTNRQQFLPVLEPINDSILIENPEYNGSLWNNIFGFETIEGQIHVDHDAREFYLLLPNKQLIKRQF
jgi:hypothetical protein